MARKPEHRPERETASYYLLAKQRQRLDEIEASYKGRYARLRSDMVDDGIGIMLRLVEKYGAAWYYEQRDYLSDVIIQQLEKLK